MLLILAIAAIGGAAFYLAELATSPMRTRRNLVHRAAVSEVFVTDLNIVGEDRFEVGAQWPRRHGFW